MWCLGHSADGQFSVLSRVSYLAVEGVCGSISDILFSDHDLLIKGLRHDEPISHIQVDFLKASGGSLILVVRL
ncbi:hypothetical protein DSUL_100002 [Desulfovibrionales bacterium]